MRRDRRFQLLFNRDRVALILDCQDGYVCVPCVQKVVNRIRRTND